MAFVSPTTWRTWKALCSVAACEPEQKTELYSVIAVNLREALRPWESGLPRYTDAELAQFFDEHFKLGYEGPDTRNKDHLFLLFANITEEAEWAKRITGYIGEMARRSKSVAEPLIRRIKHISPSVSPDDPKNAGIWVDPSLRPDDVAAKHDSQALAATLAPGFFLGLPNVYKAAVWSIANARSVTDPEVLELAGGLSKSSVANARNNLPGLIIPKLNQFCAKGDTEGIKALAHEVFKAMWPLANKWVEKSRRDPSL